MQHIRTVLAAEVQSEDACHLTRCLRTLGLKVHLATSIRQAIGLLRRELFDAAVLASELEVDGEPMIAHVSRLPVGKLLMATGPGGDWALERRARLAGATVYLPRPVSVTKLAEAFGTAGRQEAAAVNPSWLVASESRPP